MLQESSSYEVEAFGRPSNESLKWTLRLVMPCALRRPRMNKGAPPGHTPHSTRSPGTPFASKCLNSTSRLSRRLRPTIEMVYNSVHGLEMPLSLLICTSRAHDLHSCRFRLCLGQAGSRKRKLERLIYLHRIVETVKVLPVLAQPLSFHREISSLSWPKIHPCGHCHLDPIS